MLIQFIDLVTHRGYVLILTPKTAFMNEQTFKLRKLGAVVACPNADNYDNKSEKAKKRY